MFNQDNFEKIKQELGSTQLVAVSKYSTINDIMTAYYLGQRHFGESKVQQLLEKSKELMNFHKDDIKWHFIGHLQTNKVKQLLSIKNLAYIHSVDSLKLLKELYLRQEILLSNKVFYFLQINTSLEDEKSGFLSQDAIWEAINFILGQKSDSLKFYGLMTMSKLRSDDFNRDAHVCFSQLSHYKKDIEHAFPITGLKLSMGMSQDYQIALQYGADFVRIGSVLFA